MLGGAAIMSKRFASNVIARDVARHRALREDGDVSQLPALRDDGDGDGDGERGGRG
jgi:hypothetical protein